MLQNRNHMKHKNTKDAAITNPPQPSQQPPKQKSESPVQEQEAKIASSVAAVQAPEAISHEMSKSFSMPSPKIFPVPVEAQLSHVEVKRSPENQEIKRQYSRQFLIKLSKNPLSMKRPDSLPNLEIVLDYTACRPLNKITKFLLKMWISYI
ncbi:hypothetical protein Avbf_17880 [Armadillidium vulgare]|nr:hypothetical protein Avbf_17880 [Armadillidium vulgare]